MALVVVLLVLALVVGGIGLALKAAWWALVIAVALLVAGALAGLRRRSV